jgi:hypothetical protein
MMKLAIEQTKMVRMRKPKRAHKVRVSTYSYGEISHSQCISRSKRSSSRMT